MGTRAAAARHITLADRSLSLPVKETIMGEIGRHKLSDAIPKEPKPRRKKAVKPATRHNVVAEQVREARESAKAKDSEASTRDRMVDIGRGNQQSGRQGS
jgi:hypothetical protein